MKAFNKKKKPKHSVFRKSIYYGHFWQYCPFCGNVMRMTFFYDEFPFPREYNWECTTCGSQMEYMQSDPIPYSLYKNVAGKLIYDKNKTKKYHHMLFD